MIGFLAIATASLLLPATALAQPMQEVEEALRKARQLELQGDLPAALAHYDAVIAKAPGDWRGYLLRGEARFELGRVGESLADFDRVVELAPQREPALWQRGISQYYVGRFEDCAGQFALHRSVNPNDVENAAWHFLCRSRVAGFAAARAELLPVGIDPRVPMREIYRLFEGSGGTNEVLAAARAKEPELRNGELELRQRSFYAWLYIALYEEARGETKASRAAIERATAFAAEHYMGAVARVHRQLRAETGDGEHGTIP